MCGTSLELRQTPGAPALDPLSAFPRAVSPATPQPPGTAPDLRRTVMVENATRPASQPVPAISGPSMLGLNQPSQSGANQPIRIQPDMELLRDKAFSGLDSFLEPEQPKTGGRRILMLMVLLAALAGAGWWTYSYLNAAESRKSETVPPSAVDTQP